jgi:hypothetical protein
MPYKTGNYSPILMKLDIQTTENMLQLKITQTEVYDRFQDVPLPPFWQSHAML